MKQILLSGFFLLASIRVAGQMQNVDSLVNVFETRNLSNVEKLELCSKLFNIYIDNDTKTAMTYANDGLKLSEREKNILMISKFNQYLGITYMWKSSYDTALIYYNNAIKYAIEADEKSQEANVYMSTGTLYGLKGGFEASLEFYMKALAICENIGDKSGTLDLLVNISINHIKINNLTRAIDYLTKAESLAEELNSDDNRVRIYYNLGQIYFKNGEHDKSIEYTKKAYEISVSINNKRYQSATSEYLALTYAKSKDYENALKYSKEGLKLSEEFGNLRDIAGSWVSLSNVYRYLELWKECNEAGAKAISIGDTIITKNIPGVLYNMTLANIHLGNKEQALKFLRQHQLLQEERTDENQQKALANMEVKYETEKKEMRIATLEKEKQLYIWLGVAGGLLLISLGLGLLQTIRNSRNRQQLIAAKSVQEGEMGERARIAEDLHDRLGGSLAAVKIELKNAESLQSVSDKLDECIKEIREITHNLMPRSLRSFGMKTALEDFTSQFHSVHFHFFGEEKRIKERLEFIIYCCANELVTNSLRYSGAENINVQLIQSDRHVSLIVQDDGCGFDEKNVTPGIGLKNIRGRVASCNGKLDIISSTEKGTETIIELRIES